MSDLTDDPAGVDATDLMAALYGNVSGFGEQTSVHPPVQQKKQNKPKKKKNTNIKQEGKTYHHASATDDNVAPGKKNNRQNNNSTRQKGKQAQKQDTRQAKLAQSTAALDDFSIHDLPQEEVLQTPNKGKKKRNNNNNNNRSSRSGRKKNNNNNNNNRHQKSAQKKPRPLPEEILQQLSDGSLVRAQCVIVVPKAESKGASRVPQDRADYESRIHAALLLDPENENSQVVLPVSTNKTSAFPLHDDSIIVKLVYSKPTEDSGNQKVVTSVVLMYVESNMHAFRVGPHSLKAAVTLANPACNFETHSQAPGGGGGGAVVYTAILDAFTSPQVTFTNVLPLLQARDKDKFQLVVKMWRKTDLWPVGVLTRVPDHPHQQKAREFYAPYYSKQRVAQGLASGELKRGWLRINDRSYSEAYCSVPGLAQDVRIRGKIARNRALTGDEVVIRTFYQETSCFKCGKKGHMRNECPKNKHKNNNSSPPVAEEEKEGQEEGQEEEEEVLLTAADGSPRKKPRGKKKRDNKNAPRLCGNVVYISSLGPNRETLVPGFLRLDSTQYVKQLVTFIPFDTTRPTAIVTNKLSLPDGTMDTLIAELKTRQEVANGEVKSQTEWQKASDGSDSKRMYKALYFKWEASHERPLCHIKDVVGDSGNIEVETELFLSACGVDYDMKGAFPEEVLEEVKQYSGPDGWSIKPEDRKGRTDLRDLCIVSIDPTTARDLDDALSVETLKDGTYKVGVHIADVTHFVAPGTELDKQAQLRSTSIYLIQRVIPMLPRILCEQLCSLNPGVERFAFSVFLHLDAQGQLLDAPTFAKSIIKSAVKLDYGAAQALMDAEVEAETGNVILPVNVTDNFTIDGDRFTWQEVAQGVQVLDSIAKAKRAYRFENGSLAMSNPKLSFSLDAEGMPCGFREYPIRGSNKLIEEFMLMANCAVAEFLAEKCPKFALLRKHPPPTERLLEGVWDRLDSLDDLLGEAFDGKRQAVTLASAANQGRAEGDALLLPQTAGELHDIRALYTDTTLPGGESAASIVDKLLSGPMNPAKYFIVEDAKETPEEWAHFALNFSHYTHFTSPIRRYADVLVHRLLGACLHLQGDGKRQVGLKPNKARTLMGVNSEKMSAYAAHCNKRKENAKKASLYSDKSYLCLFLKNQLKDHPYIVKKATITDLGSRSCKVYCQDLAQEEVCRIEDIDCQSVDINEDTGILKIIWKDNVTQELSLFSPVFVEVKCSFGPPMGILYRLTNLAPTN